MTDANHFAIDIEPDEDIDAEIDLVTQWMLQMIDQDVDLDNLMGAMLWCIVMATQDEAVN